MKKLIRSAKLSFGLIMRRRFCDRIVVIKDKKVSETGTHEELMRLGGDYCRLFGMQASYYDES